MSRIGGLIAWNRLGLTLGRAKDALEKESKMDGYSFAITLRKGAEAFLHGLWPLLVLATLDYATNAGALTAAAQHAGYSAATIAIVVPALVAVSKMAQNAYKNHDKAQAAPIALPPAPLPKGYIQAPPERDDR